MAVRARGVRRSGSAVRCAPASPQKRPPATERAGEALSTAQASRSCRRRDGLPWGGGGEGWRAVAGRRGEGHRVGGHARFHATATAVPHGHGPSARPLSRARVANRSVPLCALLMGVRPLVLRPT